MFCFTLVRNPWDRMVSYYHWLRDQNFDHEAVQLAKALDFSAFLNDEAIGQSIRSHPARVYLTDAGGDERAALYVRLEHFDNDASPLWDHLGFRLDLPRINTSARKGDYRRYYSAADSDRGGRYRRRRYCPLWLHLRLAVQSVPISGQFSPIRTICF